MKVLILSNSNPYKTAGIVALDIHNSFRSINNVDSKLLVNTYGKYTNTDVISLQSRYKFNKIRVISKIKKHLYIKKHTKDNLKNTNRDYSVQDFDHTKTAFKTNKILKKAGFNPDIIVVVFMQTFLSYKNLYELNKQTKAPIFLYMMDMAPLTGGCHYAWDCKGYINNCGSCPAYYSTSENDQSRLNWTFKYEFICRTNIIIIAGSEWLYMQLMQSSLYKNATKYKLLLPIDDKVFKLSDTVVAKKYFDLPMNKKIIFFGAVSIDNKRKGFKQLIESLKLLHAKFGKAKSENIQLIIAGKSHEELLSYLPFNYTFLGKLSHKELSAAFNAADVFVSPSIEDSGPMMINQSIMCGTPVVAFETGVALDLVITGKTGYIAKLKDITDMSEGIQYILELSQKEYKIMSNICIEYGQTLCHPKKQVEKILEMYKINIKN